MSMKTLHLPNPSGNLTRQDKQAAVERTLYEIRTATTSLLQQIDDAVPREEVELRAEATRLNGLGFTLTRCLCFDDIETAYRIVCGDSVDGETLGLTA